MIVVVEKGVMLSCETSVRHVDDHEEWSLSILLLPGAASMTFSAARRSRMDFADLKVGAKKQLPEGLEGYEPTALLSEFL